MIKRTMSLVLCLVMLLSFGTPAVQATGTDNGYTNSIMDNIVIEDGSNVDFVMDGNTVSSSGNSSGSTKLPNPADLVTEPTEPHYLTGAPVAETPVVEEICQCPDLASAVDHGGVCQPKVPYIELCEELSEKELFAQWGTYSAVEQAYLLSCLKELFPLKHFEFEKLLNAPTGSASETYADGTTVSVQGVPQDSSLTVGQAADAVQAIVDAHVAENSLDVDSQLFSYDVSVRDGNGMDWQPETSVKMELELPGEKLHKNSLVYVVHVDDEGNATTIEATVTEDGKIAFETPGFSAFYGFTVDFEFEGVQFSINGMSSITLSELFQNLHIPLDAENVVNVEYTDYTQIKVEQLEGDWLLTSLKAFDTTEMLTLTMDDGEIYEITVTDETHAKIYKASGTGTTVVESNWDTDGNGVVTWNANGSGGGLSDSPGWTRTGRIEIRGPGTMTIRIANGGSSAETLYVDLFQFYVTGGAQVTIECDGTFTSSNKRVVFRSSAHVVNNGANKGYAMFWVKDGTLNINPRGQYAPDHMDFVIGGRDNYEYSARETIENDPVYANHPLILLEQDATALTVRYTEFMHAAAGAIGSYVKGSSVPTTMQMSLEGCKFYKSIYNNTGRTGGAVQHQQTSTSGGSFSAKDCYFYGTENKSGVGGAIATGGGFSSFNIENCTFDGCESSSGGGAIYIIGGGGTISVSDSTFQDTKAHGVGGGIGVVDGQYTSFSMTNTTFNNCDTTGYGGAIGIKKSADSGTTPIGFSGNVSIIGGSFQNCLAGCLAPNAYLNTITQVGVETWDHDGDPSTPEIDKLNGASGAGAMIIGGTIGGKLEIKGESASNPLLFENCLTWNNGGAIFFSNDLNITGTTKDGELDEALTLQYLNINKCFARDSGSAIYFSSSIVPLMDMKNCTLQNCGYFDQNDPNFPDSLVEITDEWFTSQKIYKTKVENGVTVRGDEDKEATASTKTTQITRWKGYGKAALYVGIDFGGTIRTTGSTSCVAKISNCEIKYNRTNGNGGAVYWNANRIVYSDPETKENALVTPSLTITNTPMHHNSANTFGGAIFCEGNATIQSCDIYNNTALQYGGGIAQNVYNNESRQLGETGANEKNTLTLEAVSGGQPVKVYDNTAQHGGGISITVRATDSYPHTVKDGTADADKNKPVNWNYNTDFTYEVSFTLGGTHVYNNKAYGHGGGIYYFTEYYQEGQEGDVDEKGVAWTERQRQVDSFIKKVEIDDGLIYSNTAGYGATEASGGGNGGGVYMNSSQVNTPDNIPEGHATGSTLVTISGGSIYKNTATMGNGGGVYLEGVNALCKIEGEHTAIGAKYLGEVDGKANLSTDGRNTATGKRVSKNNYSGGNGGGISIFGHARMEMTGGYVYNNKATTAGGGIAIHGNSSMYLADGYVDKNESSMGGGISINEAKGTGSDADVTTQYGMYFKNGYIRDNRVVPNTDGVCYGGGICISKATMRLDDGEISGNIASSDLSTTSYTYAANQEGGGVAVCQGSTMVIQGGTITNNKAYDGGGMVVRGDSTATLSGSLTIGTDKEGNEDVVLQSNGSITNNFAYRRGGGVYMPDKTTNGNTFNMTAGYVANNIATDDGTVWSQGGGIFLGQWCVINLSGGRIENNSAYDGGGILGWRSVMRITNGGIKGNTALRNGGGIYADYSNLTFNGGKIYSNTAGKEGGGVFCWSNNDKKYPACTVSITSGEIFGNSANDGGGFYFDGGQLLATRGTCTITGGSIHSNTTTGNGAGMYVKYATFNMSKNGVIKGNTATQYGGGAYLYALDATISNGTVYENHANKSGGGFYVASDTTNNITTTLNLTGGDINDNSADVDGGGLYVEYSTFNMSASGSIQTNQADGRGGGAYLYYATSTISNGTVNHNEATGRGGGMAIRHGSATITGGTIKYNESQNEGGGLYLYDADVEISNGTFTNNAGMYGGGVMMDRCADVDFSGGTFQKNYSNQGAGLFIRSCTVDIQSITVKENECKDDERYTSVSSRYGGGILIDSGNGASTVTINGGSINQNKAPHGAGMWVTNNGSSADRSITLNINGGEIKKNEATGDGGGILLDAKGQISTSTVNGVVTIDKATTLTMNGGEISGNIAGGNGGGVCVQGRAQATIQTGTVNGQTTHGTISENTAKNGGGVYVTSGAGLSVIGGYITYNNAVAPSTASGLYTGYHKTTSLYGAGGGICVTNNTEDTLSTFTLSAPDGSDDMAIYGNMATFTGDDVFSNGYGTKLTVPTVQDMNMSEYGFAPEGWFEDYNTDDTWYFAGINMLQAAQGEHSAQRYRNAIGQQRIHITPLYVLGEITTNGVKDTVPGDRYYVNQEGAYVAMTLGLPAAVDDTIVIDFTGPVNINLQANDLFIEDTEFASGNAYMMWSLPTPDDVTVIYKNYVYLSKGTKPEGSYDSSLNGRARANVFNGHNGLVTYVPKFDGLGYPEEDTFGYVVKHKTFWYYAKVTVIPATTLYFEDHTDFITYHTTAMSGYNSDNGELSEELAEWIPVNKIDPDSTAPGTQYGSILQGEDRPGPSMLEGIDKDHIYGFDSNNYSNYALFSGASAHRVTVSRIDKETTINARATFTFTGTGFDIISACHQSTGLVMVSVYEQDRYEDIVFNHSEWDTTTPIVTYMVDTWYQVPGHELYQVPVIQVDMNQVQKRDENGVKTDEMCGYGTYTVEIYVAPSFKYTEHAYNGADFYLDSVRIYNPAGDVAKVVVDANGDPVLDEAGNIVYTDSTILDAYRADNEAWPTYVELRKQFIDISKNTMDDEDYIEGILFIDGAVDDNGDPATNQKPTLQQYRTWGPNNEIYLAQGQSIAFTLNGANYNGSIAAVHLGVRGLMGKADVHIRYKANANVADENATTILNTMGDYGKQLGTTDMYYDVTDALNKVLVITNNSEENVAIAVTRLKVTHTSAPTEAAMVSDLVNSNSNTKNVALQILEADMLADPVVTPKYPALSFNGMVCYNVFFTAEDLGNLTTDDLGLAVFDAYDENGTVETAKDVIMGATEIDGLYMVATNGIHAKFLGDTQYFRAFAKKADGSYVYSKMVSYSAVDYAMNALAKSEDANLKQLVVAMLNYGAEAQKFFGYKTDDLMNKDLTADHQALLAGFDASSLNAVGKVDASKVGTFASTGGFTKRSPAISFKGAFEINYFMTPAHAVDGDMTLYFWNEDTYNAATELTAENADKTVAMILENGTYTASSDEIAAKYLDKTVYVAAVYESNGVTYCSGVLPYSIAAYCQKPPASVQELATAAAIYGCTAKQFFGA